MEYVLTEISEIRGKVWTGASEQGNKRLIATVKNILVFIVKHTRHKTS